MCHDVKGQPKKDKQGYLDRNASPDHLNVGMTFNFALLSEGSSVELGGKLGQREPNIGGV